MVAVRPSKAYDGNVDDALQECELVRMIGSLRSQVRRQVGGRKKKFTSEGIQEEDD